MGGRELFALDLLAGADGEGLLSALFTCLLVLWPLIALTGPATAGVTYVMRNWARGEHSFPFSDAVEHARKNWKQALAVSTITGALPLLALLLLTFYEGMIRQVNALFVVPLGLGLMAMILWALMLEVVYTLMGSPTGSGLRSCSKTRRCWRSRGCRCLPQCAWRRCFCPRRR